MARIHVPLPIRSDAYTVSGDAFAGPKARERSVYNVVFRRGPAMSSELKGIGLDNRMVFYGLSDFINEHLTVPVTHEDIDKSVEFMSTAHSFGGALPFPEAMWRRVVNENGGYLPLDIIAIPEGSTFYPGEPVIQVHAKDGFGELVAFIEPLMVGMVACASARATICRHWLDTVRTEMVEDKFGGDVSFWDLDQEQAAEIDGLARFMIHDFGMRASSCAEESELLGRAHLLTFHGTDTFNAAYQAIQMGAKRPTGTSILALAHRIVQGHDTEALAFQALHTASKQGVPVASYVSDCYNFQDGLNTLADMAQMYPDSTFVCRPDSGDYVQNVLDIVNKGLPNLRFINGDSMNPVKVNEIWNALRTNGNPATAQGIFGVGGFLRNSANRDIFSVAYKLAARGKNMEPVCKLSESIGKRSVPGLVKLERHKIGPTVSPAKTLDEALDSDYEVFYTLGTRTDMVNEPFTTLQDRCIMEFDQHFFNDSERANADGVWDMNILAIQQKYEDEYRTTPTM